MSLTQEEKQKRVMNMLTPFVQENPLQLSTPQLNALQESGEGEVICRYLDIVQEFHTIQNTLRVFVAGLLSLEATRLIGFIVEMPEDEFESFMKTMEKITCH